jgi:tape measure domain-containing protein
MNSVDERIVQMRFDNKQFESGVQTSIKSLDNLKQGLKLDGAAASLSNLERAGRTFSLAGISQGVDAIASKFTTLGIIGMTALSNITNSAVNAGKRLISSLTIDPIKTGLTEYETKMGSIQTILTNTASKGTTLDDVNKVLNDLNEYSDKTIYNFAEMTRNIGTFTAAGVDLKTSAIAIKGIANLAAGSGSNAQQASTAMYQLSQALAAGSVKLQDWNSVVNAGMGGELFQNALKKTAKEMGVVVKSSVPFRESLKTGWLSTEVLTKTLAKFANDPALLKAATEVKTFTQLIDTMKESVQSGWAQTWENIIGNKDEAAALFTSINDAFGSIVGASSDARNKMLLTWNALGGRKALIDALSNSFKGLQAIMKPIGEAFREIFPPMTGKRLAEISIKIRELTENFKIGSETADNIKRAFKGLFAVVDIGLKAFQFLVDCLGLVIKALAPGAGGLTGGLLGAVAALGDFLTGIRDGIVENGIFGTALRKVADGINVVRDVIFMIAGVIYTYVVAIREAIASSTFFSDALITIKNVFYKVATGLSDLFNKIKDIATGFGGIDLAGTTVFSQKLGGAFDTLSVAGDKVKDSFVWVGNAFNKLKPIFIKVSRVIIDTFTPAIEFLGQKLKELTLTDVGTFLGGGGLLLIGTSLKKATGSIKDITEGFTKVIDGISGSLEAFQTKLKADALLKIGTAIAVLAAAVVALSLIDEKALTKAIVALTAVFAELSGSLILLDKASLSSTGISSKLISLGVAILLMAGAMKSLSTIDSAGLTRGIEGLAGILGMLAVFVKVTNNTSGIQSSMLGLLGLATGILILSQAVRAFGSLDPTVFEQGVQGISTALIGLSLFIKRVGRADRMLSVGAGIMAIAVAMNIFAGAVALFGVMPLDMLGKGLGAIAATLGAFVLAMKLMPNDADIFAMSVGLNLMGVALYLIAGVVAIFGNMSIEKLSIGIGGLAVALLAMVAAAKLMTGTLAGAGAMLVMAIAISALVPAIVILGNLKLTSIGVALLALAGVFVVVGLSSLILAPLTPVILALAAAILILGVGVYAVGGGLILFAAGLAAIAAGGATFIAAFTAIVLAAVNLIPMVATKIGEGMVAFAQAIAKGMPAIINTMKIMLAGMIQMFTEFIIPLVEAGSQFIIALLNKLNEYAQPMVDAGMQLLISFLQGISDNIEQLTEVGISIVVGLLEGVNSKLSDIINVAVAIIETLLDGIASAIPDLINAGVNLIIDFINGLADTIRTKTPLLLEAVGNLAGAIIEGLAMGLFGGIGQILGAIINVGKAIINGFKDLLGIHSPSTVFKEFGVNTLMGFINGIENTVGDVVSAISGVVSKVISTIGGTAKDFIDAGKNVINGFIDGIKAKIADVAEVAANLAEAALDAAKKFLGIKSPSKAFSEVGKYSVEGFANGLRKFSGKAETAATGVGTSAMDSLKSTVSNISDVISGDIDMNPTIRPVLDLSDVTSGSKVLNSLIQRNPGITLTTTRNKLDTISQAMQPVNPSVPSRKPSADTMSVQGQTPQKPAIIQLMLQNGRMIAEYLVDDMDSAMGTTNKINGRAVGLR